MKQVLDQSFYARDTRVVALELLGKILYFKNDCETLSGVIVETEAYLGSDDPASHAYRGPTPRNQVMFGAPGFSYVYFTYGFHHCFNVTTERLGSAGAVLIRAIEPREGIDSMRRNRGGITSNLQLTNGPGKLTQALGLNRSHSGRDLTQPDFCIKNNHSDHTLWVKTSPRVGIKNGRHFLYRFFLEESPFVSKAPKEMKVKKLVVL